MHVNNVIITKEEQPRKWFNSEREESSTEADLWVTQTHALRCSRWAGSLPPHGPTQNLHICCSTEHPPKSAPSTMSLSGEYSAADLANLLINRCGGVDAAEDFLQRTRTALRQQGKEDGGDGGGDGGTPAPKIHKPDDQVLATRPSTGPAAEAPAESTLVAKEHDHTLQQLEMIKAKVRRE